MAGSFKADETQKTTTVNKDIMLLRKSTERSDKNNKNFKVPFLKVGRFLFAVRRDDLNEARTKNL